MGEFRRALMASAAALVLGLTAAACGSQAGAPAPTASPSPTASSPASVPASTTASPSPSPASTARLTIAQARHRYQQIVVRFNRTGDRANTDWTDAVPVAQYHRDLRANDAATRQFIRGLKSTLWPRRVEPYAQAMSLTTLPANLRCNQALLPVMTYSAMQTVIDTNSDCSLSSGTDDANAIRSLLGLPALTG